MSPLAMFPPGPLLLDFFYHWYIILPIDHAPSGALSLGGAVLPTFVRHRILAVLLTAVTLAAACSTGDDGETTTDADESTSSTTTSEPAEDGEPATSTTTADPDAPRTASFRGVTEDTIKIGVGFWDTTAFGFGFFGDVDAVWAALTGAVNERGGVNGRSLEFAVAGFNPADETGMLDACISLTEDEEVFAVLGGMRGDANFCVSEQHETIHVGSQVGAAGELLDRARAPLAGILTPGNTREVALIDELDASGWFDGATAVGIHYDGTATADRVGADVEAALDDIGVDIALTLNIDDLGLDEDTLENQTEIMREQAREAGLDRILIFGAAATGFVIYGELDARLATPDSDNFTTAISTGIDPADLDGTVATTTRLSLPSDPVDAATQQCLDDVQGALPDERFEPPGPGVENSANDPNYWNYTVLACRDLDLFVQAATAAGVELTNDSFLTGLESLTQTSLPQMPFVSFGPGKYNGGDTFRLAEFDADADEDGEVVPLGDPVDLTP